MVRIKDPWKWMDGNDSNNFNSSYLKILRLIDMQYSCAIINSAFLQIIPNFILCSIPNVVLRTRKY